jgi:hypothetical protein
MAHGMQKVRDSDPAQEAIPKLMCWNLAGAQARARPMR